MNLSPLPITHEATIPESYLDRMGHMNVMWYTHLFGRATGGLFQFVGMDEAYFRTQQAGSFALAQFFSYRREVRAGDRVTLRTRLLERSERQFHVIHFMTKGEGGQTLAATGEFLAAHIDMNTRRMSPFSPHIAEKIDRLIAEHALLDWQPMLSGAIHVR
jgi:acyl-CoA thioester hydrolase